MLIHYRKILPSPPSYEGTHLEHWGILSSCKVDWHKYFSADQETIDNVWELVQRASNSIPNNPIGFLRPEWVNRDLQKYKENCPPWAKNFAKIFRKHTFDHDFSMMKVWFESIQTLVEE